MRPLRGRQELDLFSSIPYVINHEIESDLDAGRRRLEGEVMQLVDQRLGAVARPARVHFVALLPKTRSGKLLRRALQAVAERRDPGDLTTMEDPSALQQVKDLIG